MSREADIIYIKQKKVRHWMMMLLFLLFFTIGIKLRITNVEVLGNETYTAEEAEALIFPNYWDKNTIVCLFNNIRGKKKEIPFVDDYKIVFHNPFDCELRFYEKMPVGCIKYMSNYMYFDKDGIMIESSEKQLDKVPVIEGLKFGYIVLGRKLPVDNSLLLNSIMNITQQLSLFDINCRLIKYNDANNTMTAVLDDGDIEVYLGTDDELAAKISALNDMLPEIEKRGLKGTLDLSGYKDNEKRHVSSFKLRKDGKAYAAERTETDTAEGSGAPNNENTEEASEKGTDNG